MHLAYFVGCGAPLQLIWHSSVVSAEVVPGVSVACFVIVCWRHFCVFGTSASCCQADTHRHALAPTAGDLGQTSLAEVFCDMDILAVSGIDILFFHRGELGICCHVTRLISVYMCLHMFFK